MDDQTQRTEHIADHLSRLFSPLDKKIDSIGGTVTNLRIDVAIVSKDVKTQGREIGEIKEDLREQRRTAAALPSLVDEAVARHSADCHARATAGSPKPTGSARNHPVSFPSWGTFKWLLGAGLFLGALIAGIVIGLQADARAFTTRQSTSADNP